MTSDQIDYAARMHKSLLGVVRELLADVAADGLPGDHHFYLSFDTKFPGVVIPGHLRERHPKNMTIVLQHQFWDLIVTDEQFSVQLSFNGKQESLTIPFNALTSFVDPSVQFGLPLQDTAPDTDLVDMSAHQPEADQPVEDETPPQADTPEDTGDDSSEDSDGDNVITLDRFRKS